MPQEQHSTSFSTRSVTNTSSVTSRLLAMIDTHWSRMGVDKLISSFNKKRFLGACFGLIYLLIFLCHLGCSCTMVYQSVQSKPLNIVQAQLLEQSKYQFASFWCLRNMHLLTICSVVSLLAMQWEWHRMWKLSQMLEKRATHLHLPRMVAST